LIEKVLIEAPEATTLDVASVLFKMAFGELDRSYEKTDFDDPKGKGFSVPKGKNYGKSKGKSYGGAKRKDFSYKDKKSFTDKTGKSKKSGKRTSAK